MATKTIRILLVDDHTLFRYALGRLIKTFGFPIKLVEASNGREAVELLGINEVDLILLDIQMPEMGGIETIKHLRQIGNETKIIMLTQFEDESLIVYLLRLGANGFLFKDCEPSELERAILNVMSKGHYYAKHVQKAIENNFSKEIQLSNLDISPREFQVLLLLKDGKSNKEVAKSLGLTLSTVESYRKRLIKKTRSKNTVDLVSLAYRTGILAQ